MSPESNTCIQRRIFNSLKKPYIWGTIFFALLSIIQAFLFLDFPYSCPFYITVEKAERVLNALNDIFIALFGFVGLIIVFVYGTFLTEKGHLERIRLETNLKRLEIKRQSRGAALRSPSKRAYKESLESYDKELKEIGNKIDQNKDKIKKASFYGVMSMGLSISSLIYLLFVYGLLNESGIHFFHLFILFLLFFECTLLIIIVIGSVISEHSP